MIMFTNLGGFRIAGEYTTESLCECCRKTFRNQRSLHRLACSIPSTVPRFALTSMICLARIKNVMSRRQGSLSGVYQTCLTHGKKLDVVILQLPQYLLKFSFLTECPSISGAHSYLCFRLKQLHSRGVSFQLGLADILHDPSFLGSFTIYVLFFEA